MTSCSFQASSISFPVKCSGTFDITPMLCTSRFGSSTNTPHSPSLFLRNMFENALSALTCMNRSPVLPMKLLWIFSAEPATSWISLAILCWSTSHRTANLFPHFNLTISGGQTLPLPHFGAFFQEDQPFAPLFGMFSSPMPESSMFPFESVVSSVLTTISWFSTLSGLFESIKLVLLSKSDSSTTPWM